MVPKIWADFVLMVGVGAGLYLFFDGFRTFRKYLLLADTPESRIRSLAMGLVKVRGEATGENTLTSPVTHAPCFFYKVNVEKWQAGGGVGFQGGHWSHYWTDIGAVNFYLADATGKVLIDPRGAEYDLARRRVREVGRMGGLVDLFVNRQNLEPIGSEPTDNELAEYVATHGGSVSSGGSDPEDLTEPPGIDGGESQPSWLGSVISQQRWTVGHALGRRGRLRLTEYYIAPGELYDVTGTCIENPTSQDESDLNLICKGKNEPTFLISWRGEQEIESNLRTKAALFIFGGAALAIYCLYMFIVLAKGGSI